MIELVAGRCTEHTINFLFCYVYRDIWVLSFCIMRPCSVRVIYDLFSAINLSMPHSFLYLLSTQINKMATGFRSPCPHRYITFAEQRAKHTCTRSTHSFKHSQIVYKEWQVNLAIIEHVSHSRRENDTEVEVM